MTNNLGATNRRISELIDMAGDHRLIIRPFFQRRLVWNNDDKEKFIETILKSFPFPEIFVAEGVKIVKAPPRTPRTKPRVAYCTSSG